MGNSGSKRQEHDGDHIVIVGRPDPERCDNTIRTSKYTALSFFPLSITEQFRRFANLYFLLVGVIMAVGYYSDAFDSAITPWTTLGPLAIVISFSLMVEGSADKKRHQSDKLTNDAPCVILRREDEMRQDPDAERDENILSGKDVLVNLSKSFHQTSTGSVPETPVAHSANDLVGIAFQKIRRKEMLQGHLILVKNRDMVPADMILLASSNDGGSAYIETSSIDGETNLKLRTSPHLPKKILKHLRDGAPMESVKEEPDEADEKDIETLEQATKRITRFSALAYPDGVSALSNPTYVATHGEPNDQRGHRKSLLGKMGAGIDAMKEKANNDASRLPKGNGLDDGTFDRSTKFVAALSCEPPNPHVNTFSGKLTLPPLDASGQCYDLPLGADNILLRGAIVRNTEWLIGLACYTGTDTKLVQNSFDTPSKFSQLDILMNYTVFAVILLMVLNISWLATRAVISNDEEFDSLWYVGLMKDTNAPWPYLPDLPPPEWTTKTPNWLQTFFLYVTLLSNFVPLSMYVTVEAINFFFLWLILSDKDMYDATTDTRGLARSTNISDLGQIEYIFSDKTGTLTQNVMRFKRCSVDGMTFGAPVQKARPKEEVEDGDNDGVDEFHPLRQLLVGRISEGMSRTPADRNANIPMPNSLYSQNKRQPPDGLDSLAQFQSPSRLSPADDKLTFNAEMFLRVMSLCHTVVVEKDLDLSDNIDCAKSVGSQSSAWSAAKDYAKRLLGGGGRNRTASEASYGSGVIGSPLGAVLEEAELKNPENQPARNRAMSNDSLWSGGKALEKGPDGAPSGFAYQAESPDEGALVSAASNSFGFQVVGRDSSGIKLRCAHPSLLHDPDIVEGLKNGTMTPKSLAAETAANLEPGVADLSDVEQNLLDPAFQHEETWSILAVNKFDSDRKRMSILLRSPPELGDMVVLLCKGADSAMLDPNVCSGAANIAPDSSLSNMNMVTPVVFRDGVEVDGETDQKYDDWEAEQMLGIQSHLGNFASEGLRTLVLGVRFLQEDEADEWLEKYKAAATAIKGREEKLKQAALDIETSLHIVGATAIEDKLQVGVPKTIATLEEAGIKLWVLTGDKRETAIEIGYSTHVLTPKMHLTEVADKGVDLVRAQCAMEFIRLVKSGKLPQYQRAIVDVPPSTCSRDNASFVLGKIFRSISRFIRRCYLCLLAPVYKCRNTDPEEMQEKYKIVNDDLNAESSRLRDVERRKAVRDRAEEIIAAYLNSPERQARKGMQQSLSSIVSDQEPSTDLPLVGNEPPAVFNRAQSARGMLNKRHSQRPSEVQRRSLSLASITSQQMRGDDTIIDEDVLSVQSFFPNTENDELYNKKRRTVLERAFAVDKEVRHGKLIRHLKRDKRTEVLSVIRESGAAVQHPGEDDGPRALVIEGAALKHLLGDQELEEIIFSIASNCNAVIACRVSPRQKALLVNLVRQNVSPEPVTLAIGDGANDVGMIQEAHVGVGISGKEGKQAVNASDFAIAQFRFLEELVLVHGRWDFFRLSTVVLFSFYKNALMAGCLIVYNSETVYSGTPLFDDWVIAMLNFVAGWPILLLGMFDRCLEKDYIKKNPIVYKATRKNELITKRVLIRWVILVFAHVFTLYYATIPQLALGGGMTSAFDGLASRLSEDHPGQGEGGDLSSAGTVTYTALIILLALKVLFESKSPIHGIFPAFTCNKEVGEGFFSRVGYTWVGVSYLSILFYFAGLFIYSWIGRGEGASAGTFFGFVGVTEHVLGYRSINWVLIAFVPVAAMSFDVAGKVFGNMFYPTQTQIHIEIESKQRAAAWREETKAKNNERINSGRVSA